MALFLQLVIVGSKINKGGEVLIINSFQKNQGGNLWEH